MMYRALCVRHDNFDLEPLEAGGVSTDITHHFACSFSPEADCANYWHFLPVHIDPNLTEIVRNAIAELRGATNRLNNGIMYTSRRDY